MIVLPPTKKVSADFGSKILRRVLTGLFFSLWLRQAFLSHMSHEPLSDHMYTVFLGPWFIDIKLFSVFL